MKHPAALASTVAVAVTAIAMSLTPSVRSQPPAPPDTAAAFPRYTTQVIDHDEGNPNGPVIAITDHREHRLHVYQGVRPLRLLYSIDLTQTGQPTIDRSRPDKPAAPPPSAPDANMSDIERRLREERDSGNRNETGR